MRFPQVTRLLLRLQLLRERMFCQRQISPLFRALKDWQAYPAKHQLVFALRTLADPSGGCPTGRRDGEAHEYLRALRSLLFDDRRARHLALLAREIIDEAAQVIGGASAAGEPVTPTAAMAQREAFSDQVLSLCIRRRASAAAGI